ncbi:IclR family transcriptional regulator [Tomitella cavernea]|uniref:IclR family transcriptional regulator n=1 Tax=Tomitella cavernea TaxID=1387982 RepID=A0ABP9CGK8_9ACTN|nr:IclR family transcriptional regulator [Tomitella cavernea]
MSSVDTRSFEAAPRPADEKKPLPPSMVERMTLILDAFDRRSSRLNLEEVAQRTRLPRSTAHRILDQLVKLDWLDHGSLGYGLGRRALGFGDSGNNHAELRSVANPYLHELHMRTGMVVHLSALDGSDEIFLDKIGGRFAGKLASKVGGRSGAHWNSGGRAMLAALTPEEVDDLVGDRVRSHRGEGGWALPELHQELNRIRQQYGLSIDRSGRRSMGLISVGAAVVGPEGPEAAVCLCPPSNTVPLERYAPLVLATTREITDELYPEMQRLGAQRGGRSGAPRVAGGHRHVLRTA